VKSGSLKALYNLSARQSMMLPWVELWKHRVIQRVVPQDSTINLDVDLKEMYKNRNRCKEFALLYMRVYLNPFNLVYSTVADACAFEFVAQAVEF